MITLGLDIGATKIRYAIFGPDVSGSTFCRHSDTVAGVGVPILHRDKKMQESLLNKDLKYRSRTRREFLRILSEIGKDEELKKFNFRKIGIGIAGIIEDGKLIYSPNFPKIKGINLIKEIGKIWNKSIIFENDANCLVYAEALLGAGKKYNNIVGLTLGSGLGGGIIIDKKIYKGRGGAGEIGHMLLNFKPQNFCLPSVLSKMNGEKVNSKFEIIEAEDLCSEKFFKKIGIKNPLDLELKAKNGNEKAKKIFKIFGENLGIVIANAVNVLDPDVIILGGGLSSAYSLFIKKTKETAKKFIINPKSKNIPILKARLGKSAGVIGAALL